MASQEFLHVQCKGLDDKAVPRFRECCVQVESEVVSNSRNKIHPTMERPYRGALHTTIYSVLGCKDATTYKFVPPMLLWLARP